MVAALAAEAAGEPDRPDSPRTGHAILTAAQQPRQVRLAATSPGKVRFLAGFGFLRYVLWAYGCSPMACLRHLAQGAGKEFYPIFGPDGSATLMCGRSRRFRADRPFVDAGARLWQDRVRHDHRERNPRPRARAGASRPTRRRGCARSASRRSAARTKKAPPERGASGVWDREVQRRGAPSGFMLRHRRRKVCDGRHTVRMLRHRGVKEPGAVCPGHGPGHRTGWAYSFSSTIALIGLLPEVASASENSTRTVSPS